MTIDSSFQPVVLIAAREEQALARALEGGRYAAVQVRTGTLALEWARDLQPDTIILGADLPDMSGLDVCRLLHSDLRIGHNVPIVILSPDQPTAEQRVAAVHAGAWDFLRYPTSPEAFSLRLQTYVKAKQNIDIALAEGLLDPTTGLHSRPALARRARELGALMSRQHGALACIVFALDIDPADLRAGRLVARSARICDVVGALSATEFAVLAPATEHAGAVKLARRVGLGLSEATGGGARLVPGSTLWAGYDAVANLTYSPIDPVELLARAGVAARTGRPEPGQPWVRRFDGTGVPGPGPAPRTSPRGLVLDKGKSGI